MQGGFFVTGTDTEIGKTHSAVRLIEKLQRQGKTVLAMKPVASGCERLADGSWHNDDVARLCAATGQADLALMNPYRFEPAVSPHIAAREAGVDISLAHIAVCYRELAGQADCVLVEGAGGWLAPLSDTLYMEDLARALELPVILVVGMKLGCINHALLTARAVRASGCTFAGWVANRLSAAQPRYAENLATLTAALGMPPLLELPWEGGADAA